jgi:hypothetical protein
MLKLKYLTQIQQQSNKKFLQFKDNVIKHYFIFFLVLCKSLFLNFEISFSLIKNDLYCNFQILKFDYI